MSNTAQSSPVSPERNRNQAVPMNREGYNTFDKSRLNLYTQRFSEVCPCYFDDVVEGDNIINQATQDVRTFALRSPLMNNLKMYRSFYYVPLSAIAPRSWEYLQRQPIKGDDITFTDYDISASVHDLNAFLSFLLFKSKSSSYSVSKRTYYSTTLFLVGSLLYSNSGLLKRLGYTSPYCDVNNNVYDKIFNDFVVAFAKGGDYPAGLTLSYTKENQRLVTITSGECSASEVFNFISAGFFYGTLVVGESVDASAEVWSGLSGALTKITNNFVDTGYEMNEQAPLANVRVSLRSCVAYQSIIAQFFSSSVVDSVYNCKSFNDTLATFFRDTLAIFSSNNLTSSKVNGVSVYYDAFCGRFWREIPSILENASESMIAGANFGKFLTGIFRVYQSLFAVGHSLRFGDYFTSSRTRPLAVGDTSIAVNNNQISVVDVNRSLWYQRFLNAVNRGRQDIYDYLKQMTGIEPNHHMSEPIPLVSELLLDIGEMFFKSLIFNIFVSV